MQASLSRLEIKYNFLIELLFYHAAMKDYVLELVEALISIKEKGINFNAIVNHHGETALQSAGSQKTI